MFSMSDYRMGGIVSCERRLLLFQNSQVIVSLIYRKEVCVGLSYLSRGNTFIVVQWYYVLLCARLSYGQSVIGFGLSVICAFRIETFDVESRRAVLVVDVL